MTPKEQVLARCKEVIQKAKDLYGIDLSRVRISFDLRGRAAGQAVGPKFLCDGSNYQVRFNAGMMEHGGFDHVHDNTVPHEFAHILCFMNPSLGRSHDSGWERVCISLGGNGARLHQEDVIYGNGNTYEYTTTTGDKVRMSERRHAYVQTSGSLRYKNKGIVNRLCSYSIVGVRGRALQVPIVKQAVNHPAVIEASLRNPPVAPAAPTVQHTATPVQHTAVAGESKAAASRRIMHTGFHNGHSYETIIAAMMDANGYTRQLARGTFKANAAKVGIPSTFC